MPSALTQPELRDLGRLETLARDVLMQCGFLRRNMAHHDTGDRIRFLLIRGDARRLLAVTERCERRYQRLKGAKG